MSHLDAAQRLQSATFRERGVCLQLTTPLLVSARARLSGQSGLELVVPKASGGRGHYVAPWRNIADLCQPGVHDTRLLERVGTLPVLSPSTVREAALITATEGFAGRRVRAAAIAANLADQDARTLTNYHLLRALVHQVDPASLPPGSVMPAQLAPIAKQAIRRLAAQFGQESERVARGLAAIALALAPLGLGERVGKARVPALLVMMQALRQSLETLPSGSAWEAAAAHMIRRTAEITLSCLTSALAEARGMADNVCGLVKAWLADPPGVLTRLSRAEALVDGWAWVCHLWSQGSGTAAQHKLLDEIALILPSIPREVTGWAGFVERTVLPPRVAPRSGTIFTEELNIIDAAMRNEALLAAVL